MTPEERKEIDLIHESIKNILGTLKSHQIDLNEKAKDLSAKERNLKAKARDLAAKQVAIEKLIAISIAWRVLLVAIQNTLANIPQMNAALKAEVEASLRSHEDFFLFTTMSDKAMEEFKNTLDILLRPDLKPT